MMNKKVSIVCITYNQEKYIGRVIEVQAFEETVDQNGNLSLRFPVYKCLRDIDKEVSYE